MWEREAGAAKHGRYKNKRDEGWGGSHGWLRLKRCHGDKGGTRRGRGGDVAMTSQHTEREGTGRDGKGREGKELEQAIDDDDNDAVAPKDNDETASELEDEK